MKRVSGLVTAFADARRTSEGIMREGVLVPWDEVDGLGLEELCGALHVLSALTCGAEIQPTSTLKREAKA